MLCLAHRSYLDFSADSSIVVTHLSTRASWSVLNWKLVLSTHMTLREDVTLYHGHFFKFLNRHHFLTCTMSWSALITQKVFCLLDMDSSQWLWYHTCQQTDMICVFWVQSIHSVMSWTHQAIVGFVYQLYIVFTFGCLYWNVLTSTWDLIYLFWQEILLASFHKCL